MSCSLGEAFDRLLLGLRSRHLKAALCHLPLGQSQSMMRSLSRLPSELRALAVSTAAAVVFSRREGGD